MHLGFVAKTQIGFGCAYFVCICGTMTRLMAQRVGEHAGAQFGERAVNNKVIFRFSPDPLVDGWSFASVGETFYQCPAGESTHKLLLFHLREYDHEGSGVLQLSDGADAWVIQFLDPEEKTFLVGKAVGKQNWGTSKVKPEEVGMWWQLGDGWVGVSDAGTLKAVCDQVESLGDLLYSLVPRWLRSRDAGARGISLG